jgi:hypothetical protein
MKTYLNDDSFFTQIAIPGQFGNISLLKWFSSSNVGRFRIIQDDEADADFLNLAERLELYPGITTYTVVMNPWARALFCYQQLKTCQEQNIDNPFIKYFDMTSFEKFVMSWSTEKFEQSQFTLDSPQVDWIVSGDQTVDFIFQAETLTEDFQVIQKYFTQEDKPLEIVEMYPDYRDKFTEPMKEKIRQLFKKDIEYFGYEF